MPQSYKTGGNAPAVETALADSDEAVFNLLESLLQEVDDIPETDNRTADVAPVDAEQPPVTSKVAVDVAVAGEVKVSEVLPIEQAAVTQTQAYPPEALPQWTEGVISCLLCEIDGMEIAVPMLMLRGIAVWDMDTLPMPAQPDWHLGVVDYRGEKIVVADTARLIMPEKLSATAQQRRDQHAANFIVINDKIALSCDAIKETIKLNPEQVRWRPRRPSRRWAIGTLIDRLCILMDTEALLEELHGI